MSSHINIIKLHIQLLQLPHTGCWSISGQTLTVCINLCTNKYIDNNFGSRNLQLLSVKDCCNYIKLKKKYLYIQLFFP